MQKCVHEVRCLESNCGQTWCAIENAPTVEEHRGMAAHCRASAP